MPGSDHWLDKLEPYEAPITGVPAKTMWKIPPRRYCKRYGTKPRPLIERLKIKAARKIDALAVINCKCCGCEYDDYEPPDYLDDSVVDWGVCLEWSR